MNDADALGQSKPAGWRVLVVPALLLALWLLVRDALVWAAEGGRGSFEVFVRIVESAAWLTGAWLAARVVELLLWDRLVPWWIGMRAPGLLRQFVGVLIFAAAAALMLRQTWGVALSAVLATTGVLGIVLGLAMRGILADFFSGIALNIEKPFDLGDFVLMRVRGQREPFSGTVREINWRSTRLLTPEDNLVSIPNSVVAAAIVENLSYPSPVSELEADLTLAWDVDQQLAERVLTAAATEAWALGATGGDKPPKLRICRIDGSGVTWRIVYLLDPRKRAKGPARHILLMCVHKHLAAAGLRPAAAGAAWPTTAESAPANALDHTKVEDRLKLLRSIALLSVLTDDERHNLAEGLALRHRVPGETVVRHGEPGESMFIVAEGTLGVHVGGDTTQPRSNVLGPGSVFGEMAVLTGEARSATVVALGPALLYEIGPAQMAPLLVARPGLADVLAEVVARYHARDAANAAAAERSAHASRPPAGFAQQIAARIRAWLGAGR
jgi:small-conductance mechanosensitive channel/CRP-like cAMP-binding protein